MTDKSINASDGQENAIICSGQCPNETECDYLYGGCGINVCFMPNNGYDSGINPQGSLETRVGHE